MVNPRGHITSMYLITTGLKLGFGSRAPLPWIEWCRLLNRDIDHLGDDNLVSVRRDGGRVVEGLRSTEYGVGGMISILGIIPYGLFRILYESSVPSFIDDSDLPQPKMGKVRYFGWV